MAEVLGRPLELGETPESDPEVVATRELAAAFAAETKAATKSGF